MLVGISSSDNSGSEGTYLDDLLRSKMKVTKKKVNRQETSRLACAKNTHILKHNCAKSSSEQKPMVGSWVECRLLTRGTVLHGFATLLIICDSRSFLFCISNDLSSFDSLLSFPSYFDLFIIQLLERA